VILGVQITVNRVPLQRIRGKARIDTIEINEKIKMIEGILHETANIPVVMTERPETDEIGNELIKEEIVVDQGQSQSQETRRVNRGPPQGIQETTEKANDESRRLIITGREQTPILTLRLHPRARSFQTDINPQPIS